MPIEEKSAERLFNASKKVYDVMRNSMYWVLIVREEGVIEFVDSIGQIESELIGYGGKPSNPEDETK